MQTRAAVLRGTDTDYEILDVEVVPPGPGEVLVEMQYAGLCHSDAHLRHSNPGGRYPIVGGHEGSAIVLETGADVTRVKAGDHVVTGFIPSCGVCRYCAAGRFNLCDNGATLATGQLPRGGFPLRLDGEPLGGFCLVGAFARRTVLSELSCVPIEPHVPLDAAALLACAVPTGWGSAVYAGGVQPGDTVVVVGIGGIGVFAVQGALLAGAVHVVAVDPVAAKRETALSLGATHAVAGLDEAAELARSLSRGTGADAVIVTVGRLDQNVVTGSYACLGKGGTIVLTALARQLADAKVTILAQVTTLFEHRIQGALFGSSAPYRDVPRLLRLYEAGRLEIDRLITARYALDDVNEGFRAQADGETIRGMVVHAD